MNKTLRIVLAVLGIAALWVVLASINAGLLGFGVILPVLALLDIVTGEFAGGNKMVWLAVTLAALLFAVIGIGAGMFFPPSGWGNPVWAVAAAISLVLPVVYFLIGRRQRMRPEK
ncbi:MAG: hypothetical protein JXB25_07860 [Deltaproteobacteria bacterium]|nr:hypothetical protein [Deltaproteobacteria bacterium]